MPNVIISDTSCLVLLNKIEELNLLHRLYGTVSITKEVATEYGKALPEWIQLKSSSDEAYKKILRASVDEGEASAIALALENSDALLILDDLKARKYAEKLGLKIIGTIGVLIDAKRSGYLSSIKPSLKKIRHTNFRLTVELEKLALQKAGETGIHRNSTRLKKLSHFSNRSRNSFFFVDDTSSSWLFFIVT